MRKGEISRGVWLLGFMVFFAIAATLAILDFDGVLSVIDGQNAFSVIDGQEECGVFAIGGVELSSDMFDGRTGKQAFIDTYNEQYPNPPRSAEEYWDHLDPSVNESGVVVCG